MAPQAPEVPPDGPPPGWGSSGRQLVVLGTASQAPTRRRNHNGYLLRFDGFGVLFDPGEGTQRQMVLAGVPSSAVDLVCITHLHGDHCLGLPGVLARMSLDGRRAPIEVCAPAAAADDLHRLLAVPNGGHTFEVVPVLCDEGPVRDAPPLRLVAGRLDHRVPTLGWRLEEPPGRTMDAEALRRAGVTGPAVRQLQSEGALRTAQGTVHLDQVSHPRRGRSLALVMDTRPCPQAVELARDVDLLVCESTFLAGDEELAATYGHLTATQAATIAAEAGARRLVLTHFSQRYPDESRFADEAARIFPDVVAARDLDVIDFPAHLAR